MTSVQEVVLTHLEVEDDLLPILIGQSGEDGGHALRPDAEVIQIWDGIIRIKYLIELERCQRVV